MRYKKWMYLILFFLLLLPLMSGEMAFAQSSTNYTLSRSVFDAGGDVSESTNYDVLDAVGQPSPVGDCTSTNYCLHSGFLGGGEMPTDVGDDEGVPVPGTFELHQNYPNPFNPVTTIAYDLPRTAEVELTIYDLRGHEVRRLFDGIKPAGFYTVRWEGQDESGLLVASGMYFCRIAVKEKEGGQRLFVDVKKMIFMK